MPTDLDEQRQIDEIMEGCGILILLGIPLGLALIGLGELLQRLTGADQWMR